MPLPLASDIPTLSAGGAEVRGKAVGRRLEAAKIECGGQIYRAERYAIRDSAQILRVLSPIPPTLTQERKWLAAQQNQPAFETWCGGWIDAAANIAYDIFAPQQGQTLTQFGRKHSPLSPADGRLLLQGSLAALAQLQNVGLHVPHLNARHIWLGAGGSVGLRDLWSALGSGSDAADRQALAQAVAPMLAGQTTALADALAGWQQQRGPAAPPAPPISAPPAPLATGWLWLVPVALLLGGMALFWPQITAAAQQHPLLGGGTAQTAPPPATAQGAPPSSPVAAPANTQRVMVNTTALNVRPTPDTGGAPLGQLARRQVVEVLGRRSGWLKVDAGNLRGWVSEELTLPVLAATEVKALRQATQGRRAVTLARGVYLLEQPLEIEWDTRLVGQGTEKTVLVGSGAAASGGGATILAREATLELQHLSVVWQPDEAGQPLRMERGSLKASDVRFTGGVARLDNRKVGSGVWLRSGATATIRDSRFERNAVGLSLTEQSSASVEGSRFGDNLYAGVLWSGSGGGMLRGNRLEANGETGAVIGGAATPTLSGNIVQLNAQSGIEVQGTAAPAIAHNQLERPGQRGILLGGQSRAALRGNEIATATEAGLLYQGRARGSAENNQITGGSTGIRVTEQAAPQLRANSISGSAGVGLRYGGRAGGSAANNRVTGVGESGIYVGGEASPALEGNEVSGSAGSGLVLLGKASSHVRRNTLSHNGQHGVRVGGEATPRLESNAALDNGGYGLVWSEAAGGSAERSLCQGNRSGPAQVVAAVTANVAGDPCVQKAAAQAARRAAQAASEPAQSPPPPARQAPAAEPVSAAEPKAPPQ